MMDVAGKVWTDEPWLPYQATKFIDSLHPGFVFEWGSGGSTLHFTRMSGLNRLVTVEHEPAWFKAVCHRLGIEPWGLRGKSHHQEMFDRKGLSVEYFCIPPEPGDIGPDKANPDHYKSGSTELGPCNFREYASAIDRLGLFDLILVDGMARASCLKHAVSHVKPGGVLVLDNTDDNRSYYLQNTLAYFTGWERIDFFGYGPILDYPWRCTAFVNNRKESY